MIQTPLTCFIDFVHSAGVKRLSVVRNAKTKKYDPRFDFYKPLREAIVDFHKNGSTDENLLRTLPSRQDDRKKRSSYPALVSAYLRFFHKNAWEWALTPPKLSWVSGELKVVVNPELAVGLREKPTLVKLWFRTEPLDRHKLSTILLLLQQSTGSGEAPVNHALLDVRKGKLHIPRATNRDIGILLQAEAAAFSDIYESL